MTAHNYIWENSYVVISFFWLFLLFCFIVAFVLLTAGSEKIHRYRLCEAPKQVRLTIGIIFKQRFDYMRLPRKAKRRYAMERGFLLVRRGMFLFMRQNKVEVCELATSGCNLAWMSQLSYWVVSGMDQEILDMGGLFWGLLVWNHCGFF